MMLVGGLFAACSDEEKEGSVPEPEKYSPYITQVLDFRPAPGQFVNGMPSWKEGDTQETMNQKVLAAIGNNKKGMISLGGFGGYVVVGFDHTIENIAGKRDFRVLGNAFYAEANPNRELSWWLMIKIRMVSRMMMSGMNWPEVSIIRKLR